MTGRNQTTNPWSQCFPGASLLSHISQKAFIGHPERGNSALFWQTGRNNTSFSTGTKTGGLQDFPVENGIGKSETEPYLGLFSFIDESLIFSVFPKEDN